MRKDTQWHAKIDRQAKILLRTRSIETVVIVINWRQTLYPRVV